MVEASGWLPFERSRGADTDAEREAEAEAEGAGEALGPAALMLSIGDEEGMGKG